MDIKYLGGIWANHYDMRDICHYRCQYRSTLQIHFLSFPPALTAVRLNLVYLIAGPPVTPLGLPNGMHGKREHWKGEAGCPPPQFHPYSFISTMLWIANGCLFLPKATNAFTVTLGQGPITSSLTLPL